MDLTTDSTIDDMDAAWLRMNLSFQIPYLTIDEADAFRRHWRRVGRRCGIKIRTFDWKRQTGGEIIVERITQLPGDEFIKEMSMKDARERMDAYLAESTRALRERGCE